MFVRDFNFETPTVTICEPNRYERLYDGPVDRIPESVKNYRIIFKIVNQAINNTYMEVK